jgi:hypothetical protein
MKPFLPLWLLLFIGTSLSGQNQQVRIEGNVTFVTTQNVYVKFSNTENINPGDTLYIQKDGTFVPALLVKDRSSISCLCIPLPGISLKISDKISSKSIQGTVKRSETPAPVVQPSDSLTTSPAINLTDTTDRKKNPVYKSRQQIHGFINVASYSDWSTYSRGNTQREKATLSFTAKNIGNTNLSAECYASYFLNDKQYNETNNSFFNNLKVFNLGFRYDFGKTTSLFIGRKINPKLSNMGANDGLQFELKFKPISIGIITGFRPNYTDYGFNANLFQAGVYLFNEFAGRKGFMQTTLAFIDQTNTWKPDRRFAYLQHVNSLIKNLTFFGSLEVDVYGKTLNSVDSTLKTNNTPKVTNLYLSLNYRILQRLGISFSYSNRQNVIYYETYKSTLDKLLDNQNLQGYSLQANYSPAKYLSIGASGSYRFEQADPKPSENAYGYITYSRIPGINTSATLSAIILQTGYINGKIYSAGLSKDLAKGKLYLGITYRYVDYHYFSTEYLPTYQNMGEFSLTWKIIRKLMLSLYYEGTFEKATQYQRVYAQINLGF